MKALPRRAVLSDHAAMSDPIVVREAEKDDLPALARLGAGLSRMHHRLDPRRFFVVPDMETGYAWWLGKERRNPAAVVLAAVRRGRGGVERVVGYAYGRLEPRDWNSLRDACGVGVDLVVVPGVRGRGVGRALVEALCQALAARGAPRVVIEVAARNPRAQAVFARLGFRPTLLELTRELPVGRGPGQALRDRARGARPSDRRLGSRPRPRADRPAATRRRWPGR
jgi:RimJ/RimL family protein N-acetyltransferase